MSFCDDNGDDDDNTYLSGTQVLHGAGQGGDVFLIDCDNDDDADDNIDDDDYTCLSDTQVLHGAGQGSDVFLIDCDDDNDDRRRYLPVWYPGFARCRAGWLCLPD